MKLDGSRLIRVPADPCAGADHPRAGDFVLWTSGGQTGTQAGGIRGVISRIETWVGDFGLKKLQ